MQLDTWVPVVEGRYLGHWCRVEADPEGDGFCVMVRRQPNETAELRFSDWLPSFEALHTALRDYDWDVDWQAAIKP
nr:hypothetical protein [Oceanococcus sp. HetDA_MAG_MS8]